MIELYQVAQEMISQIANHNQYIAQRPIVLGCQTKTQEYYY
jgi:hypothetical protein